MVAHRSIPQQLASIPAFKDNADYSDSDSVVASIFQWFGKGVDTPLCVLNGGKAAVFLGKEGKLYEVGERAKGANARGPKEVMHQAGPWRLPDAPDLSTVCVKGFKDSALVLDSQMRLHILHGQSPLQAVLPDHRVVQVACGHSHCLALTSDGKVYGRGENGNCQLGLGHTKSPNGEFTAVALPTERARFATSIACGGHHSIALCEREEVFAFGDNSYNQLGFSSGGGVVMSPHMIPKQGNQRFVKAACGAHHSLFLTQDGHLWGCGRGAERQLGRLGTGNYTLKEVPFEAEHGKAVDVYCDPSLHASVVLTDCNEFAVCGRVGSLFNISADVEDFLLYDRAAVIVDSRVVAMKAVANQVRIPGFDDPETCDVELVSEAGASSGETLEERATQASVRVGLDAVKVRSPYIWALLRSPCQRQVARHGERGYSVRIEKYSPEALHAYGKYIHDDVVTAEPHVAMELLELAREYMDSTGLAEQCVRRAKQSVTPQNLLQGVKACMEFGHLSVGVDLVKRQLCVANVCDVLQVAATGDAGGPQVQYIKDLAMNFAAEHATAVVQSERFKSMDDTIKGQLLDKLAGLRLLMT